MRAIAFAPDEESFFAGGDTKLIKQYTVEMGEEMKG